MSPMIVGDPDPEPEPGVQDVIATGFTDSVELPADNLQISSARIEVRGPPFDVRLALLPGETWPEMGLLILLGNTPVFKITTTEPRLNAAFKALEEATR